MIDRHLVGVFSSPRILYVFAINTQCAHCMTMAAGDAPHRADDYTPNPVMLAAHARARAAPHIHKLLK